MAGRNDQKRGFGYRDRMTREARQYREDVANNSILSGTYDTLANYLPEQSAAGATRLADYFMPFYGGAATIEEGADTLRDADSLGDYLLGGGQVALGAAEFAPIVGALAKGGRGARFVGDEAGAIRAWHGSPHDFDKFDINKIGTGEGAQAYGHGLYFAENKNVAADYKRRLASFREDAEEGAAVVLRHAGGDRKTAAERAKAGLQSVIADNFDDGGKQVEKWQDIVRILEDDSIDVSKLKEPGRLYEVEIDANPEDFLDWDAPLSEQPHGNAIQEVLGLPVRKPDGIVELPDGRWGLMSGGEPYGRKDGFPDRATAEYAMKAFNEDAPADKTLSRVLGRTPSPGYTSERLREAGIPGIRYYDQGSRGNFTVSTTYKGQPYSNPVSFPTKAQAQEFAQEQINKGFGAEVAEGTRNYVVFDDSLISILRKLGLAGTAPLGAILAGQNEGQ